MSGKNAASSQDLSTWILRHELYHQEISKADLRQDKVGSADLGVRISSCALDWKINQKILAYKKRVFHKFMAYQKLECYRSNYSQPC